MAITFISAVPGGGKTLTAVEILYKLSRDNVKNLNFNYYLFKPTIEKLTELNLLDELRTATIVTGQGLEQQTEILFFEPDHFDFLKKEYRINVVLDENYKELIQNYPDYYFQRVLHLNSILKRINEEHNLQFQTFKPVRPIFTNISGLLLSQARPLPEDYDWLKTPFGSYIVYDEAQLIEIFSDEYKKVDPIVKMLTKHRHWSYDFVFISQDPGLVHRYIRKLCGLHIHLINAFGFEQSIRLEWSTCQEQPNAIRNIARAESNKIYRFPKQLYDVYKSTTASTRVKRHPWKKYILIGAIGAAGLYGVSGLFAGDNALVSLMTGGKYGNETATKIANGEKPNEKPDSQAASSDGSAPATKPTNQEATNNETSKQEQVTNPLGGLSSSSSGGSTDAPEYTYDVANPFDYNPVSVRAPVNHRNFSGCAKWQGKYYGFDQQGTIIDGISSKDCERLLKHSYNRPFDYFNDRSDRSNQAGSKSDESKSESYSDAPGAIYAQRSEHAENARTDAATKVEPLPYGYKGPNHISGANSL